MRWCHCPFPTCGNLLICPPVQQPTAELPTGLDSESEPQTFRFATGAISFDLPLNAATMCGLVRTLLQSDASARVVDLPSTIPLELVVEIVEYLRHHDGQPVHLLPKPLKNPRLQELVSAWDWALLCRIEALSSRALYDLLQATNYLDLGSLFDLCCARYI